MTPDCHNAPDLVEALRAAIDALDRNTSPFPLSIEHTFAVLDAGRAALTNANSTTELELARAERDEAIAILAGWCNAIDRNGTGWDDWDECYHINEFKRYTSELYLGKEVFQRLRKGGEMQEHAKYQTVAGVSSRRFWGDPGDYTPRDLEKLKEKLGLERVVINSEEKEKPFGVLYIYKTPVEYLPHAHIRQFLDPNGERYIGEDKVEESAKYKSRPVKAQNFKPKEEDSVLVEKAASLHITFEPDEFPERLLVMSPLGVTGEYLLAKKPKPQFEIIGITGKKRSGKDTLADEFVKLGYKKLSFAEPMKLMLQVILGHIQDDKKEEVLPEFGVSYRHMAQTLGTEWGRNLINPDLWVKLLERQLRPGGKYVVSDVRFDNEANFIRKLGGLLIHIERETGRADTHSSESGVTWVMKDTLVNNHYSSYEEYKLFCARYAKSLSKDRSRT